MLLILLAVLSAALLGYIFRGQIKDAVKKGIDDGLKRYNTVDSWKSQVDFMQEQVNAFKTLMISSFPGLTSLHVSLLCCINIML